MHAACYYDTGGPEVFRYEEVPDPELRRGGVLIDVPRRRIQGGDLLHRQAGVMTSTPHIVGYQAAGTVREVGEGVTERHVGQRVVATMGAGVARRARQRPRRLASTSMPDGLSTRGARGDPDRVRHRRRLPVRVRPPAGRARPCSSRPAPAASGIAAIQLAKAAGARR